MGCGKPTTGPPGRGAGAPLRRSCHFCRTRKIRCSGDSNGICAACRARGTDCIFNVESTKGRPRRAASRPPDPMTNGTPAVVPTSQGPDAALKPHSLSSGTVGGDLAALSGENGHVIKNIGELDQWSRSMFALREKAEADSRMKASSGGLHASPTTTASLPHDGLLGLITQDLLRMSAAQLGRLGCDRHNSWLCFFGSYQSDTRLATVSRADKLKAGASQIKQIHESLRLQLIEMWFNVHPLSMIVSKTLFLRSYKDNQFDPALLAVIMAGAYHSYSGGESTLIEAQLIDYAEALLHDRSNQAWDLPIAQTVLLLGWHELCVKRTQKPVYFIGYAGRIATFLQQVTAATRDGNKGRANGVDIDSVEDELIRNTYWVAFAMTLWAYMDTGQPFTPLLPKQLLPGFPPVDESQSAVIKLDIASGHVSTFQSQARAVRNLWPLAHISSIIGHVYALFPPEHETQGARGNISWQVRPSQQLSCLLPAKNHLSLFCESVQEVLRDAVEAVPGEVGNAVSQALVTAAYLVLSVHLDFSKTDFARDPAGQVTAEVMERFFQSASTLSHVITRVVASQNSTWLLSAQLHSSMGTALAEIFSSGLDVVGRAVSYLLSVLEVAGNAERQVIEAYLDRLLLVTQDLYLAAKEDPLRSSHTCRAAKTRLKDVKLRIAAIPRLSRPQKMSGYVGVSSDGLSNLPSPNSACHRGLDQREKRDGQSRRMRDRSKHLFPNTQGSDTTDVLLEHTPSKCPRSRVQEHSLMGGHETSSSGLGSTTSPTTADSSPEVCESIPMSTCFSGFSLGSTMHSTYMDMMQQNWAPLSTPPQFVDLTTGMSVVGGPVDFGMSDGRMSDGEMRDGEMMNGEIWEAFGVRAGSGTIAA